MDVDVCHPIAEYIENNKQSNTEHTAAYLLWETVSSNILHKLRQNMLKHRHGYITHIAVVQEKLKSR